jgi:hypothetical protein
MSAFEPQLRAALIVATGDDQRSRLHGQLLTARMARTGGYRTRDYGIEVKRRAAAVAAAKRRAAQPRAAKPSRGVVRLTERERQRATRRPGIAYAGRPSHLSFRRPGCHYLSGR